MKILDRYIAKQFLSTAAFGLVAFTAIFVVIDLMEKLDDFLDRQVETTIIIQYYIAFVPEIMKLMTPMAILLSSLFTTGRMSNTNELTAMKSSGVSIYRYMLPMSLIALFISLFSVYFNGWIVPFANQKKFGIERTYLERNVESQTKMNIFIQDGPRRIVSIGYFDGIAKVGSRATIQDFSDTNLISIRERYDARQIEWDTSVSVWKFRNVTIRRFNGTKQHTEDSREMIFSDLQFKPADLAKKVEKPDEMNYFELEDFILRQKRAGNDVARWSVDFYGKIAFPFSSFIVVLFGVPFSFGKRRKGLAIQFGISIAICFIYLVLMKVTQVFGYNGDLDPLLTAWMANLVFFFGGILNIVRVGK